MKTCLLVFLGALLNLSINGQSDSAYTFKTVYDLSTTSVKDQHRSGTCWSFSGLSFIESEILRMGGAELDLSEMFVVRKCYEYKAEKFIRMHGETNFGAGGAFFDVFWVLKNYGLVPEDAYRGLEYGEDNHVHAELDNALKAFVSSVEQNKNRKLSTAWKAAVAGILDAYFGEIPESFEYNGKNYTLDSFTDDVVAVSPSDYISVTSFTHHPFYESFILEIPDNWLWEASYNLPIDEFYQIFEYALEKGYTIAWGGDVSEKGFSHKNGVAVVPNDDFTDMTDSERSKWESLPEAEKQKKLYAFNSPVPEKTITQKMRQEAFDNFQTTDDHGMHITGMATDQNGTNYFKVKNSWDTDNIYDGYLYMSEEFVKYKTMNIVIHKDAIPGSIKKKLNIK